MPPSRPPLPQLPAPDLTRLLRHLRPHGSVCARQRGRGRPDEAPGGEQQGGAAGGDGGEEGEGGGRRPAPRLLSAGRRPREKRRPTCPGNKRRTMRRLCAAEGSGGDRGG